MAIQHNVTGPVLVTFHAVQLGYAQDGVRISLQPSWNDVHSDDYGGTSAPPADTQFMGARAMVTCDLTKYDPDLVAILSSFEVAGAEGVLPQIGTLIRQETEYATLLLNGKNNDYTFPVAFLRQSQEVNVGSRFSTYVLGFECWISDPTNRVLFTT